MINVIVKKDQKIIKEIKIKGHSGYAEIGKDIVCASVSSMVTLAINVISEINESGVEYTQDNKLIQIRKEIDNPIADKILNVLIKMLEELEIDYPKNIKIRNEE